MFNQIPLRVYLLPTLACLLAMTYDAAGQTAIITGTTNTGPQVSIGMNSFDATTSRLWQIGSDVWYRSPLESPGGSVSVLDLKAPGKARKEYEKGYQLLMRKDFPAAVDHLSSATSLYPSFVAAHNALGSAYLSQGKSEQARAEFLQAVTLDNHLPSSYLNLGASELALKHYSAAEEATQKASAIAPLDLHLLTALAYSQFMNQSYPASLATIQQIHAGKHPGFAKVHLYAAAAWQAQEKYPEAQRELETFLQEDPKSPVAPQALQMVANLKEAEKNPAAKAQPISEMKVSYSQAPGEVESGLPSTFRKLMQDSKENQQIAEAEAAAACVNCEPAISPRTTEASASPVASSGVAESKLTDGTYVLRASAEEVAVFFAATDHGKFVPRLTGKDIGIRDDQKAPLSITGFRDESELPLRLGIVIDTSSSVEDRFKFEQDSAVNFLQKVVSGKDDLAFVIGVANTALLVQDFTADQSLLSHAVGQLAPTGGTALWDAVAFAAAKLASRREARPVARILVVISDGEDNSSAATLKQTIDEAQRGEVSVYTLSTREDNSDIADHSLVGVHALRTLADLTGGAAFNPGSVHRLNSSLGELQQMIRSRYLISYKPAEFKRNGQYRSIEIKAEKDGRKLRVYARKGYFAEPALFRPD